MPSWSWLHGHILYLYMITQKLPISASVNLSFVEMAAEFLDDEIFRLHLWPIAEPMVVVFNPDAAVHVCQDLNLPKSEKNETMIRPITGGPTLLSIYGGAWRKWRSLFNPGFSTNALVKQLPRIVDSISSFCDLLHDHADKNLILLDQFTTRLTPETIMKISLLV